MFEQTNDIKTHYVIDGPAGAPWVTFVTGIANDTTMWEEQANALSDKFRVLRYDLRGQGQSKATSGDYSVELLCDDLVALWNGLKIPRSHLVGLGLGGSISIAMGIAHSRRLISLVPCCCRAKMEPDFAAMWHKLYDTVRAQGVEAIVEPTAQRWFTEEFKAAHPEVIEGVRKMIRATSRAGYLGVVSAFLELDLGDRLSAIDVPTLFIGGAEDRVGGPEALMRGLAAKVKGADYVAIPNAAHIANIQNPRAFNAVLLSFLE